ncbi:hypothetical protein EL593_18525 [Escherichia coli]|uniref:hypothetical protein n=1 Tax=Escherichia coli TaxID=562 RepID=UPI001AE3F94A|nr:hypothetical protein [Escherichia coli]EEV5552550.1 hypothetical protein [Escherichia coli]MBP0723243.1 hypothetical protein [Escherichia coli]
MEMLGKILVIIISMIIISCDCYNAGMDYQDNIALEQVVTWDSDNIFTPNIFEHNGRCFMKKNETWMLLNGDATPNIRTMSNKKIECLEKSEVEWASRVCDSITDKERENLKALICSKPAKSVNTGKRPALGY